MRILWVSNRYAAMRTRIADKFTLPERFKGTMVEKWANYWRGLGRDYGEVVISVAKEARAKPRKALVYGGITYSMYACATRNPEELDLIRQIRDWNNLLIMVPTAQQNAESAAYIQELERALNHNQLNILSLGLFSLLWIDKYDKDDCTYPAICDYTRVRYWNFHERIVDVGFWNNFWHLSWKMKNFDVNYL